MNANDPTTTLILCLVAIFIPFLGPPIAVACIDGLGVQFIINVVLSLCGHIPGVIHALWKILR